MVDPRWVFSIHDDARRLVVGITRDGRVEIGPGAAGVDEAAMKFYEAVAEIVERMDNGTLDDVATTVRKERPS